MYLLEREDGLNITEINGTKKFNLTENLVGNLAPVIFYETNPRNHKIYYFVFRKTNNDSPVNII